MSIYTGIEFFELAKQHSVAVANVKAIRETRDNKIQNGNPVSLPAAIAKEEVLRAALVECKPRSNNEAQLKLIYLAQYLFASKGSLSDREMTIIMDSIAHLRET